MTTREYVYGVIVQNCVLKNEKGEKTRTAVFGKVLKISNCYENGSMVVQFLKDDRETWEPGSFVCAPEHIAIIKEKLMPYVASIVSPEDRIKLAMDKERCEKLANLTIDMTVAVLLTDVQLGVIKYMGTVKGLGKCIGIQLHEKRNNNKCDGSYANIQYFNCKKGFGIFITIDKIKPINPCGVSSNEPTKSYEFNKHDPIIANMFLRDNEFQTPKNPDGFLYNSDYKVKQNGVTNVLDKKKESVLKVNGAAKTKYNTTDKESQSVDLLKNREEIVTKYGEYSNITPKTCSYVRNSLSLQNILDIDTKATNSNNDFDNNTIIPPDKTYLMFEKDTQKRIRNKSELDFSDIFNKDAQKNGEIVKKEIPKHARSCSGGTWISYINDDLDEPFRKCDNEDKKIAAINKKLNEKSSTLAKSCTSKNSDKPRYSEPVKGTTNDLTKGSLVEILNDVTEAPLYGVIKWMGIENNSNFVLVGVELEEELSADLPLILSDGIYKGDRLFKCAGNRAIFVPLERCRKDSRFQDVPSIPAYLHSDISIEQECQIIKGIMAPLCMPTEQDVEAVCGKNRGIQGDHNSCYLDVTLFAMFTFTSVFDSLIYRPKGPNDVDDYDEVQRVLREEIVNPLRKNLYVSADHVMKLRKLLDRLSSVSGLTSEEKDPEEFLNSLLAQILCAEPFLKLNSGQEAFYYQLFVEKDADLMLPTVQQLFEQSFLTSNIKLKEVPSCLIIQMPRFGKNFKMYPRILPSQLLDVTDVIEESPRQCIVCGSVAHYECKDCFDTSLESIAYCKNCMTKAHKHEKRAHHKPVWIDVPYDYQIMESHVKPPRLYMELFAVICIETSHYVTFVKCGVGHEAPWCFFDSMADRKGERNGYNIPEIVACPDVSKWLSDEQICRQLHDEFPNDKFLPEHARRLFCDAYICMYQSSDVMMYR